MPAACPISCNDKKQISSPSCPLLFIAKYPTLLPSILSLLLPPDVRLPVRLHACQEARAEALKIYTRSFHNPIFINPAAYNLRVEDTSR